MKTLLSALAQARRHMKFAGVLAFLACGYLLPKSTGLATRDLLANPARGARVARVPGEIDPPVRRYAALIIGGIAAMLLAANSIVCLAGELIGQHEPVAPRAYIKVSYADTLQGVEAMFAVRACSTEDTNIPLHAGRIAAPPASHGFIQEEVAAEPKEIVVRVFDIDGREISRHEGAHDVCGFARLAAAFVSSAGGLPEGSTR